MSAPGPAQEPRSVLTRVLDGLAAAWRAMRGFLLLLKPGRFSLIMVAAGLAFLFLADQGFDTLRDFAERKAGTRHDVSQTLAFWSGGFLWVYGAWYWARVLYRIRLHDSVPHTAFARAAMLWLPRLIGAAAIFGLAIAFYLAAAPYASAPDSPGWMLKRYAAYSLAGGIAFLVFVIYRRRLSAKAAPMVARLPGAGTLAQSLRNVQPAKVAAQEFGQRDVRQVLHESRFLLGASIAIAVAMFVVFAISPEWFGPRFGSAPILLLAAAGWIAFGSAVDLFAMVHRFPVWITLLGLALAFSFFNDNHAVRTLPTAPAVARNERPDVAQALANWRGAQEKLGAQAARGTIPLILVAAEGGGIRAAYWTASVLGRIQDEYPCFADQLFAQSGVSGGSLGIAVFAAALAEDRDRASSGCRRREPGSVEAMGQAVLGEDFLAPVLAALLYPDLLQRILPVPIAHFDRARALEVSWEQAWERHARETGAARPSRLADPVDRLWQDSAGHWMPALLLNSTLVESGKRLMTSNLRLTPAEFADVEDTHRFYDAHALPLSAAVHLSARFTFVSPAGTLRRDGTVYGRAVDGGYFENSGTTAALEILDVLERMKLACTDADCFWRNVEPLLILISNDPYDARYPDHSLSSDPGEREPALRPTPCCNEVWSPLRALLATRGARGQYATATARARVGQTRFLHFGLCRNERAKIPLGWSLSAAIRDTMQDQLGDTPRTSCAAYENAASVRKIGQILDR